MADFYLTEDGDLAGYLSYKGYKISTISTRPGTKRIIFGFEPSPELTQDVKAFHDEFTTVRPKPFALHIRKIRTIISTTKRQLTGEGVE